MSGNSVYLQNNIAKFKYLSFISHNSNFGEIYKVKINKPLFNKYLFEKKKHFKMKTLNKFLNKQLEEFVGTRFEQSTQHSAGIEEYKVWYFSHNAHFDYLVKKKLYFGHKV